MARLPKVGDDSGKWGDILNDYLRQAHSDDGTLRAGSVTAATIADGSAGTAQIADHAVTADKLSEALVSEVGSPTVEDNSLSKAKLDIGVRERLNAGLADGAVGEAKLSPDVRTKPNTPIADGSISTAKLQITR